MNAFAVGASLVLLAFAASAHGQNAPRAERPYRGLFGGGLGAAEQSVVFNGGAGSGFDDNILMDQAGNSSTNPLVAKSGTLVSLHSSISYSVNKDKMSGGLSAGTSSRYYPSQDHGLVSAHNAGGGVSLELSPRATLSARESVSYQPYTFYSVLPAFDEPVFDEPQLGQLPDDSLGFATGENAYLSLSGDVGFGYQVARRTTFSAGFNHQQSQTAYGGTRFVRRGGNAGFQFTLSQNLRLNLGYGYSTSGYVGGRKIDSHIADIGLDYSKALSFSRRTAFSFSTGTAAVSDGIATTYRATGSARLNHEIGRTWTATAGFNRSVQLYDVVLGPVFQDSFGGGVGGLLNRRTQFQAGISAAIGTVGFGSGPSDDFDTYLAQANLSFAVTRYINSYVAYSFYRYRYDRLVLLPSGIAHSVDRQSIRFGVNVWAPLYNKVRR